MVPPDLYPLDPDVPIDRRTQNRWHVNGDGSLCTVQAAEDWQPDCTAADLVRKVPKSTPNYCGCAAVYLGYDALRSHDGQTGDNPPCIVVKAGTLKLLSEAECLRSEVLHGAMPTCINEPEGDGGARVQPPLGSCQPGVQSVQLRRFAERGALREHAAGPPGEDADGDHRS
jgi:hypothetical protein